MMLVDKINCDYHGNLCGARATVLLGNPDGKTVQDCEAVDD